MDLDCTSVILRLSESLSNLSDFGRPKHARVNTLACVLLSHHHPVDSKGKNRIIDGTPSLMYSAFINGHCNSEICRLHFDSCIHLSKYVNLFKFFIFRG